MNQYIIKPQPVVIDKGLANMRFYDMDEKGVKTYRFFKYNEPTPSCLDMTNENGQWICWNSQLEGAPLVGIRLPPQGTGHFLLLLQSEQQRQAFIEHGRDCIFVDATHKSNRFV